MQSKIEQRQQRQPQTSLKSYNAVPPPPCLYGDSRRNPSPTLNPNQNCRNRSNANLGASPNLNSFPNFNNGDSEKKPRRRSRGRRSQDLTTEAADVFSSTGSNGTRECSIVRQNDSASSIENYGCSSFLSSQSPNCIPGPSSNGKDTHVAHLSHAEIANGSVNGLLTPVFDVCTASKASMCTPDKDKYRDISAAKLKRKDSSKSLLLSNGDLKPEKFKYSPKTKTDILCNGKSKQDCDCSGIHGSYHLADEASTSTSFKEENSSFYSRQHLSPICTGKGRYMQKNKSEKANFPRTCFRPHWPSFEIEKALEEGEAFRCTIRVNAHFRAEVRVL